MTARSSEIQQCQRQKLTHINAMRVWAFVHGKAELKRDEFRHLRDCRRCDAIFTFFAVYGGDSRSGPESCDDGAPVSRWTQAEHAIE